MNDAPPKSVMIPMISQPTLALRAAFLRMVDDHATHDPAIGERYRHACQDFAAYWKILRLCRASRSKSLWYQPPTQPHIGSRN